MKTPFLALLIATLPAAAFAHVMINPPSAQPGQIVETQVIVGHGCSGQSTTAVHIAVPPSVGMVHVMETPGWTAKADKTGDKTTGVTWTANDGKGTAAAQTFMMHVEMPKAAGKILFPAVQTCGAVTVGWDDASKDHPAPSINVGGPAGPAMDMSHMDHGDHK
jgi:uncharacterized protein YcnI